MFDNLSYFVANVKLGCMLKHQSIAVINTRTNRAVLILLQKLGFIYAFSVLPQTNKISVFLKYTESGISAIRSIKRVSRQGARVYITYKALQRMSRNNNLNNPYQVIVLTTPKGILTHTTAIGYKVGGEVLFVIN
jgi:ribosomal protein S8